MEQRPLRLGDIVDDYCPRERRLTNHAVVAIVEEAIKQTRCTTCDHEHVYKGGKEPRKRKKDQTAALYTQVLSGLQKPVHADAMQTEPEIEPVAEVAAANEPEAVAEPEPEPALAVAAGAENDNPGLADAGDVVEDDGGAWLMHRRLIRAQLPRTGNEPPPARPIPEFTIRQAGTRGQRQWGRGGNGNFGGNGSHQGRGGHGNGGGQGRGGRGGGRFSQHPNDGNGRRGGRRPR